MGISVEEVDGKYSVVCGGYCASPRFVTVEAARKFIVRYGDSLKSQVARANAERRRLQAVDAQFAISQANKTIREAACGLDGHGHWTGVAVLDGGCHVCGSCGGADLRA